MKSTGIIEQIDEHDRITLPLKLREALNIKGGDSLELFEGEGKTLILKKCKDNCIFCGEEADLIEYEGKKLCRQCVEKLTRL